MRICRYILISFLGCCSCNNIEDAKPAERNTFIRFYEGNHSQSGVVSEPVNDGFVVVANELKNGKYNTIFRRTDRYGNEIASDRRVIPDFKATGLTVGETAYYLSGDRIQLNPSSENLFDLVVTAAVIYSISPDGDTTSYSAADPAPSNKTDLHGNAITRDSDGNIVLVGSFERATVVSTIRPFITVLDPVTLDTVWTKTYESLDRDYVNSKSAHTTATGDIIWASSLLKSAGDLSRTFLSIPYVKPESVFSNSDRFAETTDQQLYANDIQPSSFGYAVVGTFARTTGAFANMFFVRVNNDGSIVQGSERFFDGETLLSNEGVAADESLSEDTGDAIACTRDGGYVLAGSMLTTINRGSGGRDILLVKVDALGKVVWNTILGSEGDETVNSIRETEDGHLLICGSNDLAGLSSAFIIKTDKNGELKN